MPVGSVRLPDGRMQTPPSPSHDWPSHAVSSPTLCASVLTAGLKFTDLQEVHYAALRTGGYPGDGQTGQTHTHSLTHSFSHTHKNRMAALASGKVQSSASIQCLVWFCLSLFVYLKKIIFKKKKKKKSYMYKKLTEITPPPKKKSLYTTSRPSKTKPLSKPWIITYR